MGVDVEARLGELETDFEVFKVQCKDCKSMNELRLKAVNDAVSEVKKDVKASDKRNVRWHIGNLCAVIGGMFTLFIAIIIALIKLLK